MKATKITMLLAVIVGAGMLLAGITTADLGPPPLPPESIFLEIQASGKGYEAVSDNPSAPAGGIVYDESKHKLDTIPLYAMCDRVTGWMTLAIYIASADDWSTTGAPIVETEKNLLICFPSMSVMYVNSDGMPIYANGTLSIQFKEKDGTVKSAKLKSLAMPYWTDIPNNPEGNIQKFGTLKMKGKMIDPDDMPIDVQDLFGLLP